MTTHYLDEDDRPRACNICFGTSAIGGCTRCGGTGKLGDPDAKPEIQIGPPSIHGRRSWIRWQGISIVATGDEPSFDEALAAARKWKS